MVVFWFNFLQLSCYYLVGWNCFTLIDRESGAEYIGIIFMLLMFDFTYKI